MNEHIPQLSRHDRIEFRYEMDCGRMVTWLHKRTGQYSSIAWRMYQPGDFCEWPVCILNNLRSNRRMAIRILNIQYHALYGGKVGDTRKV